MPNTLTIRTDVAGGSTVSKFALAKNDSVVLSNDASASVTVQFIQSTPLCTNTAPQMTVTLPGKGSKTYKICSGSEGKTYQYTATVTGATTEQPNTLVVIGSSGGLSDPATTPIVIFEREFVIGLIAAVVGIAIGYAIARVWRRGP